ncbi:TetR/AcrR family transcriptional regulator [Streptococcus oricebi]|nr:TetR/AcrR family transcriptional regulator [Streptococcus oricebi]
MSNKKETASKQTVGQLMEVARKHFILYGYDKSSLEKIVAEVGMTRGALYHHFKNKRALFVAVLNEIQKEVGQAVEREADSHTDTWEQLLYGCLTFVEEAIKEDRKRILLIDAVNVVDWKEWREMDQANSATLLKEQLGLLKDEGKLIDIDIPVLAHLLSGALNELSLYLAERESYDRQSIYQVIARLLGGFKVNG